MLEPARSASLKPSWSAKAKGLTTQSDNKESEKSGDQNPLYKTGITNKSGDLRKINEKNIS